MAEIGSDVSVGQHGAFGCAGGSRRIDDGRQIVWANAAPLRLYGLGVNGFASDQRGKLRGLAPGDFIHHYDSFDFALTTNLLHFAQLLAGGNKNHPRP